MKRIIATLLITTLLHATGFSQQVGEMTMDMKEGENIHKKRGYSPYAGRNFPTQVYWGDTHLHTSNSLDARAFGTTLGPEEAYRLARGEEITATHGEKVKLSRPLDWLVVADHSDGMGAMNEIIKGNPNLMQDPTVKDWHERVNQGGKTALMATMDVINSFAQGEIPEILLDENFSQSVWNRYIETAERYNDPGTFTTIIGYEWTSTENGNNLHRNVLYRDGGNMPNACFLIQPVKASTPRTFGSGWNAMRKKPGGDVLALAHNGNLSNGIMFPVEVNPATGKPLDQDYVKTRIKWEPMYEITQIKGMEKRILFFLQTMSLQIMKTGSRGI